MESFVIYLMIYSVLGWICETLYCSILVKHFVNRGFLNGPYCPVYGCGALLCIWLLNGFAANIPALFVAGAVLTSALEYLTGWAMEKLFHHKWWDYSDQKYNLNGRVCLTNTVLFGLMCVVLLRVLHPPVEYAARLLPPVWKSAVAAAVVLVFLADTAVTVCSVLRLNGLLSRLNRFRQELHSVREGAGVELKKRKLLMQNRLREAAAGLSPFQRRLLGAFPHMRSERYHERLTELRKHLKNLRGR